MNEYEVKASIANSRLGAADVCGLPHRHPHDAGQINAGAVAYPSPNIPTGLPPSTGSNEIFSEICRLNDKLRGINCVMTEFMERVGGPEYACLPTSPVESVNKANRGGIFEEIKTALSCAHEVSNNIMARAHSLGAIA